MFRIYFENLTLKTLKFPKNIINNKKCIKLTSTIIFINHLISLIPKMVTTRKVIEKFMLLFPRQMHWLWQGLTWRSIGTRTLKRTAKSIKSFLKISEIHKPVIQPSSLVKLMTEYCHWHCQFSKDNQQLLFVHS